MANRIVLNNISYHGKGALSEIVSEVKAREFKKAFICTDPDLLKFNVTGKVTDLLDEHGLGYEVFSRLKPNPTITNVQDAVRSFLDSGADYIVAVGGGSSMDTAKAVSIIAVNPGHSDVRSLEGAQVTPRKSVFTIAVPTTAGTAAETTINYVVTDVEKNSKFVCVDPNDIPDIAIVDPDMMASMPRPLAAATGMDALTHAIEGYITKGAWAMSDMFHIKAVELISENLRESLAGDETALENMALAQYIAGMGYSNVGLGLVHSMSHTLGALYDTPHGIANAILLPTVMEYNAEATGGRYRDIARAMGLEGTEDMSVTEYRCAAVSAVRDLSSKIGIPGSLKGIARKKDLDFLAESAYADACRPGNPRDTNVEDIKMLFESLL